MTMRLYFARSKAHPAWHQITANEWCVFYRLFILSAYAFEGFQIAMHIIEPDAKQSPRRSPYPHPSIARCFALPIG